MRRFTPEERAAQKALINQLYEESYGRKSKPGDPTKYDVSQAGPQGNLFNTQAQAPKGAITSNIPEEKQIEGTMFAPTRPEEPSLFDSKDGQEDKR